MEAIAELIAALVGALLEVLFGLLEAIAALLAAVLEFVFLAVTQGMSAASRQYKHRKEERAEHLAAAKKTAATPVLDDAQSINLTQSVSVSSRKNKHRKEERTEYFPAAKTTAARSKADHAPSINLKQFTILVSLVFFVIICSVTAWVVRDQIRKQRIADTRSQVKNLADTFARQIKDGGVADPEPGKLRDRDAWQQPVELFVDKALLGSLVVVRSSGPDRKSGSIDDILATRVIRASVKDVGGKLANRGIKAIRDRVARLLPGGDKEQLPKDIEVAEQ